jgi:glutathione peroxidase
VCFYAHRVKPLISFDRGGPLVAVARPSDVPRWNFRKYLIGRDGYIAEVFAESVEPLDTRVKTSVARALAAS